MSQPMTLLIGRTLVGVLFLVAGIRQFMFYAGTVGYFGKLGFPAPEAMVWLSIILHIVGGVMLIVGWKTQLASWVMLALVVVATAMAHRFWQFDAAQYGNQLNHFLKNVAIIGGLLYVASFGAGAMSVDGRKRGPG
jgi:putative oxidoreductase